MKLIHFFEQPEEWELYALKDDPEETRNLAGSSAHGKTGPAEGAHAELRREWVTPIRRATAGRTGCQDGHLTEYPVREISRWIERYAGRDAPPRGPEGSESPTPPVASRPIS